MLLRRLARVSDIAAPVEASVFAKVFSLGANLDVEGFLDRSRFAFPVSLTRKLAAELGRWLITDPGLELTDDCFEFGRVLMSDADRL